MSQESGLLLPVASYHIYGETPLFRPVAHVIVPARTKPFNAAAFYQTSPNLYVFEDDFDQSVGRRPCLRVRQTIFTAPERPYAALLLKKKANDKCILTGLSKTHPSKLEDIAGLIKAQPGGKEGFLLNVGSNIIYVEEDEDFVVEVSYGWGDRRWNVNPYWLCEFGPWDAGCQVICPGYMST